MKLFLISILAALAVALPSAPINDQCAACDKIERSLVIEPVPVKRQFNACPDQCTDIFFYCLQRDCQITDLSRDCIDLCGDNTCGGDFECCNCDWKGYQARRGSVSDHTGS